MVPFEFCGARVSSFPLTVFPFTTRISLKGRSTIEEKEERETLTSFTRETLTSFLSRNPSHQRKEQEQSSSRNQSLDPGLCRRTTCSTSRCSSARFCPQRRCRSPPHPTHAIWLAQAVLTWAKDALAARMVQRRAALPLDSCAAEIRAARASRLVLVHRRVQLQALRRAHHQAHRRAHHQAHRL